MNEIVAVLEIIRPLLAARHFRQLLLLVEACLSMTGRVTMLGLSRWAEPGGSYRTIQRFFNHAHDWGKWRWLLLAELLKEKIGAVIFVADEVVVTKAGKHTFGLGRFFSSLQKQVIPSLCFVCVSLAHVESNRAYPLLIKQLIRSEEQKSAPKAEKQTDTAPKKRGRPKGSRNKTEKTVELSPFLQLLQTQLRSALTLIGQVLSVCYLAYDGALGHYAAVQMAKELGLYLVSKLRHDAALYFPYTGEYSGRGRPRKYGDKFTKAALTAQNLRKTKIEGDMIERIYQLNLWHKSFPMLLNVVIIVKTNQKTQQSAKVLLFSNDLALDWEALIRYYELRFQIEFNFRDAKQHWGLEDFMNVKATQVTNAANFSLFMVTLSQILATKIQGLESRSMLDLKTVFRARKYTRRIINALGIKSESVIIDDHIAQAIEIGRIYAKAA